MTQQPYVRVIKAGHEYLITDEVILHKPSGDLVITLEGVESLTGTNQIEIGSFFRSKESPLLVVVLVDCLGRAYKTYSCIDIDQLLFYVVRLAPGVGLTPSLIGELKQHLLSKLLKHGEII